MAKEKKISEEKKVSNDTRERVVRAAWEYIEKVLTDPNTPQALKDDIAKSIIIRDIPQRVEGESSIVVKVKQVDVEERISCLTRQSRN